MKQKSKQQRQVYLDPLHSIGYLARINFRAFSRALEKLTITQGVTAGQWRFLRVLWEQDNITQRELSNRVGTKEASTVRAVKGLVKCGFVTRKQSSQDKRKYYIVLTPKARRLQEKLIPMVVTVNEQALKGLSKKDINIARRVLVQTYDNLQTKIGE